MWPGTSMGRPARPDSPIGFVFFRHFDAKFLTKHLNEERHLSHCEVEFAVRVMHRLPSHRLPKP
jgi:hypothetical protein